MSDCMDIVVKSKKRYLDTSKFTGSNKKRSIADSEYSSYIETCKQMLIKATKNKVFSVCELILDDIKKESHSEVIIHVIEALFIEEESSLDDEEFSVEYINEKTNMIKMWVKLFESVENYDKIILSRIAQRIVFLEANRAVSVSVLLNDNETMTKFKNNPQFSSAVITSLFTNILNSCPHRISIFASDLFGVCGYTFTQDMFGELLIKANNNMLSLIAILNVAIKHPQNKYSIHFAVISPFLRRMKRQYIGFSNLIQPFCDCLSRIEFLKLLEEFVSYPNEIYAVQILYELQSSMTLQEYKDITSKIIKEELNYRKHNISVETFFFLLAQLERFNAVENAAESCAILIHSLHVFPTVLTNLITMYSYASCVQAFHKNEEKRLRQTLENI